MKNVKTLIAALSVICIVLLSAFFIALYNYNALLNPENTHEHSAECNFEYVSHFYLSDVRYAPVPASSVPKKVTPDKFLGFLSDFKGAYSVCPATVAGGLYTIEEDDNILIAFMLSGKAEYFAPSEE